MFLTRLQRVGFLSLAALILGGLILILSGLDGLIGPTSVNGKFSSNDKIRIFYYGSNLSIQTWIAILGIGFGLLSYGYNKTYIHIFDWWCSRRAQCGDGLDYGTYLNSQPQAPVIYGRRGFFGFINLHYLLTLASIATSIGYKFGVTKAELSFSGTLGQDAIRLNTLWFREPTLNNAYRGDSPWLSDQPYSLINHAFLHEGDDESAQPPRSTIMTGVAHFDSNFGMNYIQPEVVGTLYTREIVVVANRSEFGGDPGEIALDKPGIWSRAHSSDLWFDDSEWNAVVEYAFFGTDELHVRWAKQDPWYSNSHNNLSVVRRVVYKLHYAVAEVIRDVYDSDCSPHSSTAGTAIRLLSNDDNSPTKSMGNIYTAHRDKWAWAEAMMVSWGNNPYTGVSSILQVAMTIFLDTLDTLDVESPLQFVPSGTYPFGTEKTSDSLRRVGKPIVYPFLEATGWTATGIWISAAYVFLAIGCFSVIVGLVRIYIGPPLLTSWMGQHVFLAQTGAIHLLSSNDNLATGYKAASVGLINLRVERERLYSASIS